ncbi:MAG: histidine kinase [Chloroflexi bacterium HGW-Chloroflexi-10]|nr:MAG: histidine kinase [Chloroflexi bacterium HGW-Chloroflexi-10]
MASPDKIRVIIVDDIQETRENIRRMLQFDPIIDIIGEARTGREAIEQAHQKQPDVVIMDINMPDMDGLVATEAIRKRFPYIQVIILSVQSDPSYMRRAMLAGARDFLAKPPMIDELTNAIRQAGKMATEEKRKAQVTMATIEAASSSAAGQRSLGKIIVIYSPKGGTGCTTISTNLAIALHSESTPSAMVDANMQFGDIAVFLNEQGRNTILDLAPRADELDAEIINEVMIKHSVSGIHVLASPPRPEYADNISVDQFTKILQFMQKIYGYIIVDTTSYLTEIVQSALDIANVIILVATQDIPAIKSSNLFLGLSDASGINRKRILFVLNRFDKRISITPERVGESLRQVVEGVIPFEDRVVTTSINRGTPFIIENKSSVISKSIYTIADKIKGKILEQHEEQTAANSKY